MARNNDDFTYEIQSDFDFILSESGNQSINLRRISWNGRPHKLDIRKWNYKDGQEQMSKGISLTDEAANELASVLVEQGNGDTKRIARALAKREDFKPEYLEDDGDDDAPFSLDEDTTYYDPKQII